MTQKDLTEVAIRLGEVKASVGRVEERLTGYNDKLSLHLDNIEQSLEYSRNDRASLHSRIDAIEDAIGDINVDVARLVTKWSVIMLLITAIISAGVASSFRNGFSLPEVLPPKTEIPTQLIRGNE